MIINLTEITNNNGKICKVYSDEGVLPAANVFDASGKTLQLEHEQISDYLDSLCSEQSKATILGINKYSNEYKIVKDSDERVDGVSTFSRTSKYFDYANNGSISLMLLDFDSKSENRDKFFSDLEEVLSDALIGSTRLMHWTRPSTSGGVSIDGKTGDGLHIYIPVKNAKPELIELIHRFCWLQDYGGGYKITKSGNVLPESMIDNAVKGPERLIYTSDAFIQLENAVNVPRQCDYYPGGSLDCELSVAILEDLTVDFMPCWRDKKVNLEASEEVKQVKEQWKKDQIAIKVAYGIPEKQAKQEVNSLSNKVLLSSDFLYRTGGEKVQVVEILKDPDTWVGEKRFADPIKQDVSRNVAMVLKFDDRIVLKSFNHGGVYYHLKWSADDLTEYVKEMEDEELEDRVGELINNSDLNGIKRKALIKGIAKRLDVGIMDVDAVVKEERVGELEQPEEKEEEDKWIYTDEDAAHIDILNNYLFNQGSCKGFGGSLYVWGDTIWKKQTIGYVKSVIGEKNKHVGLCRRMSDYSQLAKEIVDWDKIVVEEWSQSCGFPAVDGFWEVREDEVVKVPYAKELNCRYKFKVSPDFDYEHKMPYFQRILDNVDSPLLFQQICGLAASGKLVDMQMAAVFQGTGGTGKGTISRVLSSLFPKNRLTSITLAQMNDPKYLVNLMDSVLNIIPEQDKGGKKITMTGFRSITGGDAVSGWGLYKGVRTFKPSCSHILNINAWPHVDGAGEELFRRVGHTIVRFDKKEDQEQIVSLDRLIIENELPKILGWLIDGVELYLKNGLDSGNSKEHYQKWVGSFDPVELFIEEFMEVNKRGRIKRSDCWLKFNKFCEESNYFAPKKGEFFACLREHRHYRGESVSEGYPTLKGWIWR